MSSIAKLLNLATKELAWLASGKLDAETLLSRATGKDRSSFYAWPEAEVPEEQAKTFLEFVKRRKTGLPVAYIIGYKDFYQHRFKVTTDTLIPRPETEILVETAVGFIHDESKILELGTGSGAIGISLKLACPHCEISLSDISQAALVVAKENAKNLYAQNINFIQSDWFENINKQKFDLIISNPPYVALNEIDLLNADTKHEPESALFAGSDGLQAIRHIIARAKDYLKTGGRLMLEHGFNQSEAVTELFTRYGFVNIKNHQDLQGHIRISLGAKPKQ